jgi:peptidoglycan/xylan/chitin deacetylase (PgdA/CDA1 family)
MRQRMRAGLRRLLGRLRGPAPVILMYHRVAAPAADPWGLAVSPANFRDQLAHLARRRTILTMDAFMAARERGELPARAVGITFDDGYRDNLLAAAPLLAESAAPATVFLTGSAIGSGAAFWWDELARMILLRRDLIRYDLTIGGVALAGRIPAMAADKASDPHWRAWTAPRTAREAAYVELWQLLQRVQPVERAAAMAALRETLPPEPAAPEELPMSPGEVARLAEAGISIGGHAMTHQPLTTLAAPERRAEIAESRAVCLRLAPGEPVAGFAFPHGDRDPETIAMVREAGYAWACSTQPGGIGRVTRNLFDLPRVAVPDVGGPALMHLLGRIAA